MKSSILAMLAVAVLAGPTQASSQLIKLSCYERLTWGGWIYNGTHSPNEDDPLTTTYTIDLARQRWKGSDWGDEWRPFARTTPKEIYLVSNQAEQLILRRGDLQIMFVAWDNRREVEVVYSPVIRESRCRRLPRGN
ncbi:MAG TPA: hypothetical protein VEB39_03270 [Sphingomicrobium sp.]|nr:hypothetical protein [Sphingomicrobium sp.]